MTRVLFLALLLWPAFATAQAGAPPAPVLAPTPATVRVVLTTTAGPITLALEKERAPLTTANFLRYVDARRLDGTAFYRAMKLGEGLGLIQGGLRNDPRKLFAAAAHEPTTRTGLTHDDGAISMAREAPGSATADFFVCVGDLKSLDADPKQAGDNQGFAVFGHVVAGMEVVRAILAMPTSPTDGTPAMRGQMLAPVVKIVTARRQ